MSNGKVSIRFGERGQIVVFVAVSLVALLGMGALSIDAAYMYDQRNKLYAAADAAAKSAAFAYKQNTTSVLWEFGKHEVELLGLTPVNVCGSTSGTALCVNLVTWHGNPNFVEAIVSRPQTSTFFGRVLGWMSGSPGARAVAGTVNPASCVIVNQDLKFGNFEFTLNGCGMSVGDNIECTNKNGSRITGSPTPSVNVTGPEAAGSKCDSGSVPGLNTSTGIAPPDPLKDKLTPPTYNPATCTGTGSLVTIGPGCYSNVGAGVRNLLPGDYIITGTFNIDDVSGTDVFLYLTNDATIGPPGGNFLAGGSGNHDEIHLTAHSTGPYAGIAIWQDVNDHNQWDAKNQFTIDVTGAIYMPGVDQEFKNTLDITPTSCSLFIARSLTIGNGNGTFNNSGCSGLFGGAAFLSIAIVE